MRDKMPDGYIDALSSEGAQETRKMPRKPPRGGGSPTTPPDPLPTPLTQRGWAGLYDGGNGVTGGEGGTVYNCTNFTQFKSALQASGPRIVKVLGTSVLDGAGATVSVTNDDLTIEGPTWTRSMKRCHLVFKNDNLIIRNMRIRPGDYSPLPGAAAAIMLNPGAGNSMAGVLIENCSLAWAGDVCLNIFNGVDYVTIQNNIIGPSLYETPYKSGFNGYALSMHGDAAPNRHKRISLIRNLIIHSYQRNLRCYAVEGAEYVNNVVYNWGNKLSNANPVWANFVGNMAKKGPGSPGDNQFYESQLFGDDSSYFPDSVYFTDNLMWDVDETPLTPVNTFASGVRYTAAPLDGPGTSGALHNVTATAASLSLAATVVDEAGTTTPDALEQEWKDDFTNGTWNGSDPNDWYRGPGVSSPLVVPTW